MRIVLIRLTALVQMQVVSWWAASVLQTASRLYGSRSLFLRGGRTRWRAEALTPYARRRALANFIPGLAAVVLAI